MLSVRLINDIQRLFENIHVWFNSEARSKRQCHSAIFLVSTLNMTSRDSVVAVEVSHSETEFLRNCVRQMEDCSSTKHVKLL